jgi:hypothetical protein
MNYKKLGLDVYVSDKIPAEKLAEKVIPLFNGMTFLQIEMGLELALKNFKCAYTIKGVKKD